MIVKYLIVHHSASGRNTTIEDMRAWHLAKGWSDIGYHKVIYQNGEVKQGRSDAVQGAQAFGANAFSLGICCIGNFDEEMMPNAQEKSLVQVLAVLCRRHKLTEKNIIGHRDVAKMFNVPAGASACPGRYVDIEKLRKQVKKYL